MLQQMHCVSSDPIAFSSSSLLLNGGFTNNSAAIVDDLPMIGVD
jgi:hypothetical protein